MVSFKKNDMLNIKIEDMGVNGEGIGKVEGIPFFVKDAVIGDLISAKIIKMKKNYGYARLLEVLEPSPQRVEPKCPYYKQCGGCQLQPLSYSGQLEMKERKVKNNLMRIGGFSSIPYEGITGMEEPYYYRNKAIYPIGKNKDGKIIAGFYASRSHTIIDNRKCYLGVEVNERILDIVISFMEEYQIEPYDEVTGKGLVRHVLIRFGFHTKEIMVCLVVNGKKLPHSDKLVKELQNLEGMKSITLNVNRKNTNVILGEEIINLWGQNYISDFIGGIKFQISPLSFYQVNPNQTEKLYKLALDYAELTGEETVWDLYCGIGTISLFLAQRAKRVYGVEIVPQAIEDAKVNAEINQITNASFFIGKAEEVLPEYFAKHQDEVKVDVIVVDPPRKGCDQVLLDTIVQMEPERVVYVSCDSATLARDLKYLCERGYEVLRVQGIDMFGQTVHVETCVALSRRKNIDMIEIKMMVNKEDIVK